MEAIKVHTPDSAAMNGLFNLLPMEPFVMTVILNNEVLTLKCYFTF